MQRSEHSAFRDFFFCYSILYFSVSMNYYYRSLTFKFTIIVKITVKTFVKNFQQKWDSMWWDENNHIKLKFYMKITAVWLGRGV